VHDPHLSSDLREISAILSRTALKTPRRVFVATIAVVLVMGVVTGVAARAYHDARHRGARAQFELGEAAANTGQTAAALEHYRAALALDRDHSEYRRALAIALISLRRTAEADTHLEQLLESDPVDGEANLLLARINAGRGAFSETEAFYQRAIYGRWSTDESGAGEASARRLAARFELIEWLVQMGAIAPARAEQLRLQTEVPDVPFLQLELARRMLALGQPAPAAAILRRELARRADAAVAADLARAEMETGRFVEARAAARRALNLDARDQRSRERLAVINEVLALDPTLRGLPDAERFRRAQLLLRRVHQDLLSCTAIASRLDPSPQPSPRTRGEGVPEPLAPERGEGRVRGLAVQPAELAAALSAAENLLEDQDALGSRLSRPAAAQRAEVQKPAGPPSPDATPEPTAQERIDARLAAAATLWKARVARCGAVSGPMAWIFDRVAT
jgi:Flp pilus assembly protein TadD